MAKVFGFLAAWLMHYGAFYVITMLILLLLMGEDAVMEQIASRRMPMYLAVMAVTPAPALWQLWMFNIMSRGSNNDREKNS